MKPALIALAVLAALLAALAALTPAAGGWLDGEEEQ